MSAGDSIVSKETPLRVENLHIGGAQKRCTKCKKEKPISSFFRSRARPDGHHSHCKTCHTVDVIARMKTPAGKLALAAYAKKKMERPGEKEKRRLRYAAYSRRKRYGISEEDFALLLSKQNHACRVCRTALDMHRRTHVDHDHVSGRIRGILCHHCNTAIGLAGENASRLRAMAEYLETQ